MTRARSLSQLANSSVFTVATNNRVGIGSEVPTAKLDVDGTLNVSGNATIGGVATYEDVTNVDSVGIVTARSGVSVPDGQKIQLGNSNDLQIYHTGSHSLIDESGTGNLTIRSSLISFEKYTNEQLARFTADGSCELFHDNSKKLETTSTGVSITGAGTFSGLITANGNILSNRTGSTQTVFQGTLSGVTKVNIQAGGAATFAGDITSGNAVTSSSSVDGSTRYSNGTFYISRGGSNNLIVGRQTGTSGNTVEINADGSALFNGGVLSKRANGTEAAFAARTSAASDNAIELNADGSASFAGSITAAKSIILPDSSDSTDGRVKFGASTDMMLYHYGGANYLDVTNTFNIRGGSGATINIKPKNDEEGIIITPNGSVKLYYDNSSKFETTSTGVSVTGAALVDSPSASTGGVEISRYGVYIRSDDSYSKAFAIHNGGYTASDETILFNSNGSATFAMGVSADSFSADSSGYNPTYKSLDSGTRKGVITANGSLYLGTNLGFVNGGTPWTGGNVVLNGSDGSATFGQASNSTNNNGILLGANVGQLNLYTTRYSTDCFQILNTSGSGTNVAVRFDGDGSGAFAGPVSATGNDGSSGLTINTTAAGKGVTVLGASGGDTRFAGDGSAIFKGTSRPSGRDTRISLYGSLLVGTTGNNVSTDANCSIDAGNGNIISSGSATFAGPIKTRQDSNSALAFAVTQGGTANSDATIRFNGNGSATFRDTITSGASDRRGQFLGTCPSSVNASIADAFVAQYNGSTVFSVKYTGAATFASEVVAGVRDSQGVFMTSGGALESFVSGSRMYSLGSNGSASFTGNVVLGTSNTTAVSQIYSNGSTGGVHLSGGGGGSANIEVYSANHASLAKTMRFQTNSLERMRILSGGQLLVGHTSLGTARNDAPIQIATGSSGNSLNLRTRVSDDIYAYLNFTNNAQTNVAASIHIARGPSTNATTMVLSTASSGVAAPTERVHIDSVGNFKPGTDNGYSMGASGKRWTAIHATNGTIQTSDQRDKTEIETSVLGTDFIKSLRPVSYKWKVGQNIISKDEDGETDVITPRAGIRRHWGFVAQEVKQSVDTAGVDFGGWVLDDKDDSDSQQSLRYDQFIAPLTKALQEAIADIESLKAEVAALKAS